MRYLLDTNTVSALVNDPGGPAFQAVRNVGQDQLLISVIVLCEIEFGLAKKQSDRLTRQMREIINTLEIAVFDEACANRYGKLREEMRRIGFSLAPNDLLIAAHAMTLEAVLVTDDQAFGRVPGLTTENWIG